MQPTRGPAAAEGPPGLRLMLLRHAKSSRDDRALPDRDRPLALRGIKAATAMGEEIRRRHLLPDLILCSPARRAQDTLALAAASLPPGIPNRTLDALYDFGDGSAVLEVIRTQGGTAQTLMLVGHNPSLAESAHRLLGNGPDKLRHALETKFPTGALAVIRLDSRDWHDIREGQGHLEAFIRPRDLPHAG